MLQRTWFSDPSLMPNGSNSYNTLKHLFFSVCTATLLYILYNHNIQPQISSNNDTHVTLTNFTAIDNTFSTMAWRSSGLNNTELISNLYKASLITSARVRDAMLAVDRAHYCPNPRSAYEDSPQFIGFSATISAPHMHASASESLERFIPENDNRKVLDIGSGSGYLTHVLANMVCGGDGTGKGKVVGIDHIQGLVDMATGNMGKSVEGRRLLEGGKVEFVLGDGRKGCPEHGPYDAIHVGAAAKELHQELVDQLKSPGRMFIPVEDTDGWGSQWIWVVDKDEKGVVTRRRDMGVRYVPLTDRPRDGS